MKYFGEGIYNDISWGDQNLFISSELLCVGGLEENELLDDLISFLIDEFKRLGSIFLKGHI